MTILERLTYPARWLVEHERLAMAERYAVADECARTHAVPVTACPSCQRNAAGGW